MRRCRQWGAVLLALGTLLLAAAPPLTEAALGKRVVCYIPDWAVVSLTRLPSLLAISTLQRCYCRTTCLARCRLCMRPAAIPRAHVPPPGAAVAARRVQVEPLPAQHGALHARDLQICLPGCQLQPPHSGRHVQDHAGATGGCTETAQAWAQGHARHRRLVSRWGKLGFGVGGRQLARGAEVRHLRHLTCTFHAVA